MEDAGGDELLMQNIAAKFASVKTWSKADDLLNLIITLKN